MIRCRSMRRFAFFAGLGGIGTAVLFGAAIVSSQEPPPPTAPRPSDVTHAAMRGIFTTLATVYTYSLDVGYFQDRRNRDTVVTPLEALVANTGALEEHSGKLDPTFDYLRQHLAADAMEALELYQKRQYLGSKFMVNRLMENCAICHSRLPEGQAFDTGSQFLKNAHVASVPPVERVTIEIAARQFDKALSTYEEIFALPGTRGDALLLIGAFEGYLKIAIGVRNDTRRPIQTLTAFLKRDDVAAGLRDQVRVWIEDLSTLDLAAGSRAPLATARRLVGDAAVVKRPPSVRPELVRMVAANALLHRYLQTLSSYDTEASEVYFLLAVTESRISRSYWISETDFLLERAVRSTPKSEFARKALAVLEGYSAGGHPAGPYSGSEAPTIDLEELRKLVEG